jgi:hypothetical protein
MIVAGEAGQTQIAGTGGAAMLAGDDVVNLEMQLVLFVVYLTVFAAAVGSLPNQFYQLRVHTCLVPLRLTVAACPALERAAGLGLHQRQNVPDALIIVNLILLSWG